jgi:hypothetical protein
LGKLTELCGPHWEINNIIKTVTLKIAGPDKETLFFTFTQWVLGRLAVPNTVSEIN